MNTYLLISLIIYIIINVVFFCAVIIFGRMDEYPLNKTVYGIGIYLNKCCKIIIGILFALLLPLLNLGYLIIYLGERI